jgi:hypothetical protein
MIIVGLGQAAFKLHRLKLVSDEAHAFCCLSIAMLTAPNHLQARQEPRTHCLTLKPRRVVKAVWLKIRLDTCLHLLGGMPGFALDEPLQES